MPKKKQRQHYHYLSLQNKRVLCSKHRVCLPRTADHTEAASQATTSAMVSGEESVYGINQCGDHKLKHQKNRTYYCSFMLTLTF